MQGRERLKSPVLEASNQPERLEIYSTASVGELHLGARFARILAPVAAVLPAGGPQVTSQFVERMNLLGHGARGAGQVLGHQQRRVCLCAHRRQVFVLESSPSPSTSAKPSARSSAVSPARLRQSIGQGPVRWPTKYSRSSGESSS